MTDPQPWVAQTYDGLADLLTSGAPDAWDAPSLCEKWQVRHVVAHVTMPVRLTPELFGAEMAAARGDFAVLSDTVAARDGSLPVADLAAQLRSPQLHAWLPPGGGAAGAVSHAVIHSLDVTIALDRPPVAPVDARAAVLDQLAGAERRAVRGRPHRRPPRGRRHGLGLGRRRDRASGQRPRSWPCSPAGRSPTAGRCPGTDAATTDARPPPRGAAGHHRAWSEPGTRAVAVGFEPTEELPPHTLSRRAP